MGLFSPTSMGDNTPQLSLCPQNPLGQVLEVFASSFLTGVAHFLSNMRRSGLVGSQGQGQNGPRGHLVGMSWGVFSFPESQR